MKAERNLKIFLALMLAIGALLTLVGCADRERRADEYAGMMKKAQGYSYVMGAMTARGFDTPPYIPGKIKFELEIYMREKGLLAPPSPGDRRLVVSVESEVIYPMTVVEPSRVPSGAYQQLISTVRVTDAQTNDAVAEVVFRSFNGFGSTTSDFTEREQAKSIAAFLETIVK